MRLVPLNNETWNLFRSWFPFDIPPPKEAILVAEWIDGVEYLIGGTCIYSTDGPYVLFEHFGLNQQAPILVRHAVAKQVFRAAKSYCTIHNKVAFTWVNFAGGVKMLQDVGFTLQPAQLLTFVPGMEPAHPPKESSAMEQNNIPVKPKPAAIPEDDDFESAMERMRVHDEKAKAVESSGAPLEDEEEEEDDDLLPEVEVPKKKAKRAKRAPKRRSLA